MYFHLVKNQGAQAHHTWDSSYEVPQGGILFLTHHDMFLAVYFRKWQDLEKPQIAQIYFYANLDKSITWRKK